MVSKYFFFLGINSFAAGDGSEPHRQWGEWHDQWSWCGWKWSCRIWGEDQFNKTSLKQFSRPMNITGSLNKNWKKKSKFFSKIFTKIGHCNFREYKRDSQTLWLPDKPIYYSVTAHPTYVFFFFFFFYIWVKLLQICVSVYHQNMLQLIVISCLTFCQIKPLPWLDSPSSKHLSF